MSLVPRKVLKRDMQPEAPPSPNKGTDAKKERTPLEILHIKRRLMQTDFPMCSQEIESHYQCETYNELAQQRKTQSPAVLRIRDCKESQVAM